MSTFNKFLLTCLIVSAVSFGQGEWVVYSTLDGLIDDQVYSVARDHEGVIWAGTNNGLSFYNGDSWVSLTDRTSMLPHNKVYALVIDNNNTTWIGTSDGLAYMENYTLKVVDDPASSLVGEKIVSLAIDNEGNLWCATMSSNSAVSMFDGSTWTTYDTADGLADMEIRGIAADGDGNICIGYDKAGLGIFDGETWTTIQTNPGVPLVGNRFRDVVFDPNGSIWCATNDGISNLVDEFTGVKYKADDIDAVPTDRMKTVAVDSTGKVWFGTYEGAVTYKMFSWELVDKNNSGLPTNTINDIFVEPNGNIWFATDDAGIAMLGDTSATVGISPPVISDKHEPITIEKYGNNLVLRNTAGFAGPVNFGIFDIQGRRVKTISHTVKPSAKITIPVDGLSNGQYFLNIESESFFEKRLFSVVN